MADTSNFRTFGSRKDKMMAESGNRVAISTILLLVSTSAAAETHVSSIAALEALGGRSASIRSAMVDGYYSADGIGGGHFIWRAGNTDAPDDCVVFPADGIASGRWVRKGAGRAISVLKCGAKGDGVSDDTRAEQAAVKAAARNGEVVWPATRGCYRTADTIVVSKSITLSGPGTICWVSVGKPGFTSSVGEVTFDKLALKGPGYSTFVSNENGIEIHGAFHSSAAPGDIEEIVVKDCTILDWGDTGILVAYARGIQIKNNTLKNLVYAGIGLLSTSNAAVNGNTVSNVTAEGTPGKNAYGIYISRSSADSANLVSQPRSAEITISDNAVYDVPTWEAYDTHAGQKITFSGNKSQRTRFGIAIGSSANALGVYSYAPLDVTVSGNAVDSGVSDGSAAYGISFTGCRGDAATGSIVQNTVEGFGFADAVSGAINLSYTKELVVRDNVVRDPSPTGIFLGGGNYDLSVVHNTIIGPWTNSPKIGEAIGLGAVGDNNTAIISENSFLRGRKGALFLLTTKSGLGMRFSKGKNNRIVLDANVSDASTPVYDPSGAVVRNVPSPSR